MNNPLMFTDPSGWTLEEYGYLGYENGDNGGSGGGMHGNSPNFTVTGGN